jgi:hypothetical protein
MTEKNGNMNDKPKNAPAWDVFFVGPDGKITERTWTDKKTGEAGKTWDKRGALWMDTTKDGTVILSGTIKLADGTELRLKMYPPRPKKEKEQ